MVEEPTLSDIQSALKEVRKLIDIQNNTGHELASRVLKLEDNLKLLINKGENIEGDVSSAPENNGGDRVEVRNRTRATSSSEFVDGGAAQEETATAQEETATAPSGFETAAASPRRDQSTPSTSRSDALPRSAVHRGESVGAESGPLPLRLMQVNCRSIRSKKNQMKLHALLQQYKPDIIIGTESWLHKDDKTSDLFTSTSEYVVYRRDRQHKKGGGIFMCVKIAYESYEEVLPDVDCELLCIELRNSRIGSTLKIIAAYRAPDENLNVLEELKSLISEPGPLQENVVIGGDLNLPKVDWLGVVHPQNKAQSLVNDLCTLEQRSGAGSG